MKKSVYVLVFLSLLVLCGCFQEKNTDKAKGVVVERRDNVVAIIANENFDGAKLEFDRTIDTASIKSAKGILVIPETIGNKTVLSIAKTEEAVLKQNEILTINSVQNISVKMVEVVSAKAFKSIQKRASMEELLGDFDGDNTININDFIKFAANYGKTDMSYDIGPATKGESEEYKSIYAHKQADGKIDINDFIVFAGNFGKSVTKTIKNITIVGDSNIEMGKNASYTAKIEYSNGDITTSEQVAWSSSNPNIASLVTSGNSAVVTAKNIGTVNICADKAGKQYVKTVTVTNVIPKNITINIEETASSKLLYAWTKDAAAKDIALIGAWPGKTLTTKVGKFYTQDFGTSYSTIYFIHNVVAKSADLSTDKSVWIMADGTIKTVDPYAPSKPIITITPNKAIMNPEQKIVIEVSVVNNTIDTISGQFNNKAITLKTGINEILVKDYLTVGQTGELFVSASNNLGTSENRVTVTSDATASTGVKLYMESNSNLYAWATNSAGAIEKLNGDWPGKPLVTTVELTGHKWYVLDFGSKESGMYIINGKGGESGSSISKNTWIKADNSVYTEDPYLPTKPMIAMTPGNGTINNSKNNKTITIKVTARNATVDSKSVVIGSQTVALTKEETILNVSDYIANGETKKIKVTATNSLGTVDKEVTITRDDTYVVPTGPFTWDNATVYFVLTDRFFNGNPANDNSYGRKNKLAPSPLDIATFHGGDVVGLTKKIEEGYFNELGVNTIWLTATYEQIHGWVGGGSGDFPHYAYHGYYALDWTMMDRNMGTIDEMRKFVDTAHENNIRVVMDIVLNHGGYNTVQDMYDYGFASYDKSVISSRDWMHPMVASGWQSHHGDKPTGLVYYKTEQMALGKTPTPMADWLKWWGPDWVRAGIEGYTAGDGTSIQDPLCGLPDIRTETTVPVAMAPIMKTKWKLEAAEGDDTYDTLIGGNYSKYIVPAAKYLRNPDAKITPADHVIKSLAAWVEEFGIDGFRCDTAKHVELFRWKQLQSECNASLKKWRAAHPADPSAKWTDDFWMVGEYWDFKNGMDLGFFTNGFKTMIDFGFPLKNGGTGDTMLSTWAGYSKTVNKGMPYLNSHDMGKVGFFGKGSSCIPAGTALLLNPSPVQIFYGDENDREKGVSCSDADHMLRSDYQWGMNPEKLAHWQKVGRFRNLNPAVGGGVQTSLTLQTGAIKRVWKDNVVVIVVNANGKMDINLSEVTEWPEGTKVRNGYNGEEAVITGGKVSFTGENGIILIENALKIKR